LTGLGAGSWAVTGNPHLVVPECQWDLDIYDGVICDNTVKVRAISFQNYHPQSLRAMWAKIAIWDEDIEAAVVANETALFDFTQDVDHTIFSKY
jgi:hypothetical protein